MVSVDWSKLKDNTGEGTIDISQNGTIVSVKVSANAYTLPATKDSYFGGEESSLFQLINTTLM